VVTNACWGFAMEEGVIQDRHGWEKTQKKKEKKKKGSKSDAKGTASRQLTGGSFKGMCTKLAWLKKLKR